MNQELRDSFKASIKRLEDKGYVNPVSHKAVYDSGLDVRIEVPFEEAVPVRGEILPGQPMTRRQINERLRLD